MSFFKEPTAFLSILRYSKSRKPDLSVTRSSPQLQFMRLIHLIFLYLLAWSFGFWMWRLTLARGVLFLMSARCSVVMCGAWPCLCLCMIYSKTPRLVSDMRLVSELLVTLFYRPVLCRGKAPVRKQFAKPNMSVVVKLWFLEYMVLDGTFMCSVFTATLT